MPKRLMAHDWERYRKATPEEIDAVVSVLESGHLSIAAGRGMPQAEALQREFAEWVGADHCLVVNSGTAALHCAVAGVGVEPGDEVIVPAYTFVASAMVVLHQNAIPVFVDIDPQTYLIDASQIQSRITGRTRAIMPVHIHGLPADMDEINAVARRCGLQVIEDSAQAYGALYKGRKTGTLGDVAGFAMTTTKQLMTGEGGLLTTNSSEVYGRASMLRLFGEAGEMSAADRLYMSEAVGWNYKLPEVVSALARVRLRHLDDYITGTQRNAARLTEKLQHIEGLIVPKVPADRAHTYYLYSIQVDPAQLGLDIEAGKLRDAVMMALAAENVDVQQWQKVPVPAQPLFQRRHAYGRGCPWTCHGSDMRYDLNDFPNAVAVLERSIVLRRLTPPNGFDLVDRYAEALEKVFSNIHRVVKRFDETETYVPVRVRMARLSGSS